LLAVGCEVRLIHNKNVADGLVNNSTGTVIKEIYDDADKVYLLPGRHPLPYCVVVDFPQIHGFVGDSSSRVFPFPHHQT
jgi:hypothetical protein